MARNRVPAKPSPVRTPSPKHWTSPQTHCSPSVREQTRMLFIIGRSLFVLCQDYCCKHLSFLERWGEEATDGTCTTNAAPFLQTYLCMTEVEHSVPCSSRSWFERRPLSGRQTRSLPLYTPRGLPGSA